jgi:hypothetical protein
MNLKRVIFTASLAFAMLTTAAFAASVVNFDVLTAFNNTGKLDITNNEGVFRNATLSAVASQITTGYDGGDWLPASSPSITSTNAAVRANSDGLTGVGFGSNDVLGYTTDWNGATFPNGALSGTSNEVLVQYTYFGDTDLSGKVDRIDLTTVSQSYRAGGNSFTWTDGDTDYNGTVDRVDLTLVSQAYNYCVAHPSAVFDITPVPEPATWSLLVFALVSFAAFKTRKK